MHSSIALLVVCCTSPVFGYQLLMSPNTTVGKKQSNSSLIVDVDFQRNEPRKSSSDEYRSLRETKLFIDKTLLIREIFCHKSLVISAPRYFGKTTNLNMLRLFLSESQNKSVAERAFEGTKVWRHQEFFERHCCAYPVLACSFCSAVEVVCLDTLVKSFRQILLGLFYKHFYLNSSDRLTKSQKEVFVKFIKQNKQLSLSDLAKGLRVLAEFISLHHGKKVIVLIDDYDSIIFNNIFDEHYKQPQQQNEQLNITRGIVSFHKNLLCNLVKDREHVDRVIMTGVLSIELCDYHRSHEPGLESVGFMQSNRFSKYYGFTEEEVISLVFKFRLNRDDRVALQEWYCGYVSPSGEEKVFNTLSLSEFIISRVGSSYWCQTKPLRTLGILPLLDNPTTAERMVKLANNSHITIAFNKAFTTEDLLVVKKTVENWWTNETRTDPFFQILFQMGYLTFGSTNITSQGRVRLKVPNEEIRKEAIQFVYEYFDVKNLDQPDIVED